MHHDVAAQAAAILAEGYRQKEQPASLRSVQSVNNSEWASGLPFAINIVAGSLSFMACIWQLARLRQVRKQLWRCLLLRQVRQLALADGLYALSSSVFGVAVYGGSIRHPALSNVFCPVVYPFVELFRVVSVFTEAHIALGLACGSIEYFRLHRFLGCLLPSIWLIGFGISAAELVIGHGFPYNPEQGSCDTTSSMPAQSLFWVLVISFSTACLAHLSTLVYLSFTNRPMQRAVWRRMQLYPVNFLISYSLILYIIASQKNDIDLDKKLIVYANGLELMNGFLNVCAYTLQGAYAQRLLTRKGLGFGICTWDSDYDPESFVARSPLPATIQDSPAIRPTQTPSRSAVINDLERTVSMNSVPEITAASSSPPNCLRACSQCLSCLPRPRTSRTLFDEAGPVLTPPETSLLCTVSYLEGADMLRTFVRPGCGQTFSFMPVLRSDSAEDSMDASRTISDPCRGRSLSAQSLALLGVHTGDDHSWRCSTQAPILLEQLFQLGNRVGGGAFGEVFKVRAKLAHGSIQKDAQYAVKVLTQNVFKDERILKYAYQERDVMREAKHPCLVRLVAALQVHEPVGKWILVMEYCMGGSLRGKLFEIYYRPNSVDPTWHAIGTRYCAEVLLGMEYLHSKDIVHRDLKPDNVVLSDCDHCKIVDFGVARVLPADGGAAPTRANSWRSGSSIDEPRDPNATNWVGTGVYTAPEVQLGQYGSAVDIFSWGVMVFEILAVTNPEPQTEPGQIHDFMPFFRHHLEQHEVATTALPLLEKATNSSPEMRGTARALKDDDFFRHIAWDELLFACEGSC